MNTFTPIPPRKLGTLQKRYEVRRKSLWASPVHGLQSRKLLPYIHGDGGQVALISFYAAPEICIVILLDSKLPLDLPEKERFLPIPPPSFRDLLDTIYNLCEDTWSDPPCSRYRIKQLTEELKVEYGPDPDDHPSLWSMIIAAGGTWIHI